MVTKAMIDKALAARQPVGQEPDEAAIDELRRFVNSNVGTAHGITRKQAKEVLRKFAALYAAPPAQAVDLDKARDEGHDGAIRYVLGYLNGTGDCGSTMYEAILNACGREQIIASAARDGELGFTGLGLYIEKYGTDEDRALIDTDKAVQS